MINDKRKLEFYNYILKLLSQIKLFKMFKDFKIIDEMEETLMSLLNNFENCNFNKINYFSKEEVITPSIGFTFIFNNEDDETLFKINDNNEFELPFSNFELFKSFDENINNFLNLNSIKLEDYDVKGIINILPLRSENNKINDYFSTPEYLFVLSSNNKIYNINEKFKYLKKEEIKDSKLFSKNEILKFIEIAKSNEKFYKE